MVFLECLSMYLPFLRLASISCMGSASVLEDLLFLFACSCLGGSCSALTCTIVLESSDLILVIFMLISSLEGSMVLILNISCLTVYI